MTSIDIGDTITVTQRDRLITGVIVGLEPSVNRRGYPTQGFVCVVQPERGEAVEVHISQQEQTP